MTAHIVVVLTNAVPGRDAEFNDWYTNVHVPEVLGVPEFAAAWCFGAVSDRAVSI